MDGFIQTIDTATQSHDYGSLATIFTFGPSSWQALGQVSNFETPTTDFKLI